MIICSFFQLSIIGDNIDIASLTFRHQLCCRHINFHLTLGFINGFPNLDITRFEVIAAISRFGQLKIVVCFDAGHSVYKSSLDRFSTKEVDSGEDKQQQQQQEHRLLRAAVNGGYGSNLPDN